MVRILVVIVVVIGGIFAAIQQFHFRRLRGDVQEARAAYAAHEMGRLERILVKLPKVRGENGIGPLLAMVQDKALPRIDRQVAQMALWRYRESASDRKISQFEAVVRATAKDLNVDIRDISSAELEDYLSRSDPAYRMAACRGYALQGKKAPDSAKAQMLEMLENDAFYPVRAEAARALATLGETRAAAPLAKVAKELTEFGLVCVKALGEVPGTEARQALEGLLELRQEEVAHSLELRGDRASVPALAGYLAKWSREARIAVGRALAVLGDNRGMDALKRWLEPGPLEERKLALKASRGIVDPQLLELLVACASERDDQIRMEAAWALGGSDTDLAAGALRALLTDNEVKVQARALQAIAARKDAGFQEILVEKLHSGIEQLVLPAIDGVVGLGLTEETGTLKAMLKNPDTPDAVAKAAWLGLKEMTGVAPGLDARRRSLFDVAKPIGLP